jgi:demethylmenaquinone methyltransferase/2-methoxy-6-polyprenyl-1,4-benzoquinol methylase
VKETVPYNSSENKKNQIIKMFDNIASTYDILNHILSLRMDFVWRKTAIRRITNHPKKILDIATGTGDLAICAAKYTKAKITGIDISENMLAIGRIKIDKEKLTKRITFNIGDAEKLTFKNNSFNVITAGFGVRNFENIDQGLLEMYRVLDNNGILIILEPSKPSNFPIKQIYSIYFSYILPLLGRIISKDKNAYTYFIKSVSSFPSQKEFLDKLKTIGFKNCKHTPLTFGVVSLYSATK